MTTSSPAHFIPCSLHRIRTTAGVLLALVAFLLARPNAEGAVILTLSTPTTAGSLEITAPIVFNLTSNSVFGYASLVLDEWVAGDGEAEGIFINNFAYLINGSPTTNFMTLFDNEGYFANAGPNDGDFRLLLPSMTSGSTFTVAAGTYVIPANTNHTGFNPLAEQTFTGNMFIVDQDGTIVSDTVSLDAAPEPSRSLLLMLGLVAAAARRRRR